MKRSCGARSPAGSGSVPSAADEPGGPACVESEAGLCRTAPQRRTLSSAVVDGRCRSVPRQNWLISARAAPRSRPGEGRVSALPPRQAVSPTSPLPPILLDLPFACARPVASSLLQAGPGFSTGSFRHQATSSFQVSPLSVERQTFVRRFTASKASPSTMVASISPFAITATDGK